MRLELTEKNALISSLKQGSATPPGIIVIDGVSGAGQERLANTLVGEIGGRARPVDPHEDPKALCEEVGVLREAGTLVLYGSMMRTVLVEAGLDADLHLYLVPARSNPRRAFWEGILSKPLDLYLAELDDELDRQTVLYHWQTHPVINADHLIEES